MPAPLVLSLAKKSGKSKEEVETMWKEVKTELLKTKKETDVNFYGTLVLILKRKLKLKDADAFPIKKKLVDFTNAKLGFTIDEIEREVKRSLKDILKPAEDKTVAYAEFPFKGFDGIVACDIKGGIEIWVYSHPAYVKKGTFKTIAEFTKLVKSEYVIVHNFYNSNSEKILIKAKYEIADSLDSFLVDEGAIVTSEAVGPFRTHRKTTIEIKKRIVCGNCQSAQPKSKVTESFGELHCQFCGTKIR